MNKRNVAVELVAIETLLGSQFDKSQTQLRNLEKQDQLNLDLQVWTQENSIYGYAGPYFAT